MSFAEPIRVLILDVDGVMTDGGIIRDDAGQQLKRFHVRDGAGIVMWKRMDKDVVIITGKESAVVDHRAGELGIELVYQNVGNKLDVFKEMCEELEVTPAQCAYIGDDLPDLPVMKRVGAAIAVADAVEEVKAVAKYVTKVPGGYGAVREGIEWLLKEMNMWEAVVERYTK